jgi:hypothetical protein
MLDVLGLGTLVFWMISYVDDNTLVQSFQPGTTIEEVFNSLTTSMGHWCRLLQVTGGDLCLEKCKVSVMTWKWNNYWGIPNLQSIQETRGGCNYDIIFG